MKLLLIALLILISTNAFSQGNVDTFYQLKKNEYTSAELIRELVTNCKINIYYSSGEIDSGKTKFFKSGKVKEIIDQLALVNNADFKLVNDQFILKRKKQAMTKTSVEPKSSITISPSKTNTQVSVARSNESNLKWLQPTYVEPLKTQKDMKLKSSSLENFRKKTLASLAAAMLLSNTNTFSQFDIGITAGGNFSYLAESKGSDKALTGFQFGLSMITPINKSVHIRNDILYTCSRMETTVPIGQSFFYVSPVPEQYNFSFTQYMHAKSVKIPITLNYVFQTEQMNFYFGIGGFYEYILSGTSELKWKNKKVEKTFEFSKSNYYEIPPNENGDTVHVITSSFRAFNRNQLGLVANMGISRKEWIFNLSYEPSLIQYPIEGWGHLHQWKFNITYLLDFRRKKE